MTLTGTYDFGVNTELDSVIVEAYERIGREASDLALILGKYLLIILL